MSVEVTSNKQGQSLGRKGLATRQRLMDATEQLLKTLSPVELTAVAIAKEAKTSSATFYMYFDDVNDILFALSSEAGQNVVAALESLEQDWSLDDVEVMATRLVETVNKVWDTHRSILLYRNMEADRGNQAFIRLRMEIYSREIDVLSKWILKGNRGGIGVSTTDAYSLAVVLHAGLERLSSLDPEVIRKGIGLERCIAAQARIIALVITSTPQWGRLPISKTS